MNPHISFRLKDYILPYTGEEKSLDVFEELERSEFSKKSRKFSLSLPSDFFDDEDKEVGLFSFPYPLLPSSTPPTSPNKPVPLSAISIQIPEDKSFNSITFYDTDDECYNSKIKDIQTILDFSKKELLISSYNDKTVYKMPPKKSNDAYKIWKYAKIPYSAIAYHIELLLIDWAYTFANLEVSNKKIIKIKWKSEHDYHIESSWSAFLKWILCATNTL